MGWLALLFLLGIAEGEVTEGKILELHGRGFSFQVLEPEGWVLDTYSAPQIANFIFHPQGMNWRRADAVIYSRFAPRNSGENLETFLQENRDQFFTSCPEGEESELKHLKGQPVEPFRLFRYTCPRGQTELVAFAEYPGHFVVFALTGRNAAAIAPGEVPLRGILQSFRWTVVPRERFRFPRPDSP